MSDPVAITLIQDMVRADLEQAWDLLCNGSESLAERELHNALEKISQLKTLRAQSPRSPAQLTITLEPSASSAPAQETLSPTPTNDQGTTRGNPT